MVAGLLIGPQITVHHRNGRLATRPEAYWWCEWQYNPTPIRVSPEQQAKLRRSVDNILSEIGSRKEDWKKFVEERFIEFHDAFSEPSYSNAFMKGWTLFERLAGVEKGGSNVGIKRACSLFGDADNARIFARHLRLRRNQIAHASPVLSFERHRTCVQLKTLIEPLIVQFLFNLEKMTNPSELWKLLDAMACGQAEIIDRQNLLIVAEKRLSDLRGG